MKTITGYLRNFQYDADDDILYFSLWHHLIFKTELWAQGDVMRKLVYCYNHRWDALYDELTFTVTYNTETKEALRINSILDHFYE